MPTITIDGRQYEVEEGQNLLASCLSLGLNLPYFCWHPAMGSVGACRQCAIIEYKDSDDAQGKLVMGCMTQVRDGGIYSLDAEPAREFRGAVIEDLMTNHPHDCPVCEEGGECHLQDMTEMSGHTYRRFRGLKRTHRNQYLGPFINHEMNRCIACYRCVRFYRDYAGGDDLEALGRNNQVYFGRQCDGKLESGFSGNLVEVCPTGVFTDQTFSRHFVRKWDLQTAPSVCEHCGVGCNTAPGARMDFSGRDENLRRVVNLYNRDTNGYFICDRGRFGYEYANSDLRIKNVLIARREQVIESTGRRNDKLHREIEPPAALEHLATVITDSQRGRRRLVGIGSPRTSLENNFALRQLVGPGNFFAGLSARDLELLHTLDHIQRDPRISIPTIPEIEDADVILVLDEDIGRTAPRVALALRQAARNNQRDHARQLEIPLWQDACVRQLRGENNPIFVLASSAPASLEDIARAQRLASPAAIVSFAEQLAARISATDQPTTTDGVDSSSTPLPDALEHLLEEVAETLLSARRPLVISGCGSQEPDILAAAGQVAAALADRHGAPCATYLTCPETNSLGLAQFFGPGEGGLEQLLEELRQRDSVDPPVTLLLLENDLYRRLPAADVESLFDRAAEVVLFDSLLQPCSRRADLVFPASATPESQGTLVNSSGMLQRHYMVYEGSGYIQESWRWLVDAVNDPACSDVGMDSPAALLRQWKHCHDVTAAIAAAVSCFRDLPETGPDENFRIEGMKLARQSHRASGRTANRAHWQVAEQAPLTDPDSPFSFTMEGVQYAGATPLQANIWSPGWNSNQAIHKFQQGVGGPRRGREPIPRLRREPTAIPVLLAKQRAGQKPGQFCLVPTWQLFGSGELSNYSDAIAGLADGPCAQLNTADAGALGLEPGGRLQLRMSGAEITLPASVSDRIAPGVIGIPVGLRAAPDLGAMLPAAAEIVRIENPEPVEPGESL
ncbi:NADH-quinone oxidoreductase subunit NuoG [Microbulbifer sediminum]|uniref:NADH-quinone oxidoreductase subunit NuoG n=1 Tax=Microbulbifer sediminum TaxID=2904250 RepID=UPI001F012E47|nr:NADH-quinone oxidoreductase subunit NuoG [Microbulbifer sediminum]